MSNVSDTALDLTKFMSEKNAEAEINEDHGLSDRALISDQDDRILVTSLPIDNQFFEDTKIIFGFKNIINLYPRNISKSLPLSILEDKKLIEFLVDKIRENPKIELISYAVTPEFLKLTKFLKEKTGAKLNDYDDNYIHTQRFFDSKSGFRQSLSTFENIDNIRIPEGFIVHGTDEIFHCVNYFFSRNKGVVIKTNRGLAGAGLLILDYDKFKHSFSDYLKEKFNEDNYWKEEVAVVEEFIKPNKEILGGSPDVELKIIGGKLDVLYTCGMRITEEGVFRGIELGKNIVPKNIEKKLIHIGKFFGKKLIDCNYHGFYDVDAVLGDQLCPIEANIRRTGGTHVYEGAIRLLGNNFAKKFVLISNNIFSINNPEIKSYSDLKECLQRILYPINGEKRGLLITTIGNIATSRFGYMIVGSDRNDAVGIENEMLDCLGHSKFDNL